MQIRFEYDDHQLTTEEFAELFGATWPQWRHKLNLIDVEHALALTINLTARDQSKLAGCLRILSDGCFMSVVCDIIVDPNYRSLQLAGQLLSIASEKYPKNLLFAAHPISEESLKPWGWQPGYPSYVLKKEHNRMMCRRSKPITGN